MGKFLWGTNNSGSPDFREPFVKMKGENWAYWIPMVPHGGGRTGSEG